jgi:hypothetical protein
VVVGDFLKRENHKGEGREFIGKGIVEDVGEGLAGLPMLTGTNPKLTNRLTYVPSASRKMEQGIYPTLLFPDGGVVGEVDASVGWI